MSQQDRRRVVTLALFLVGGAVVCGSVVGLLYGVARDVVGCVCAEDC